MPSQASPGITADSNFIQGQCLMFFRTKIRCLPCAQGVSPYIDRVVSTSCFYPVKDMKGVVGHSPLWRAAYWVTPAWNTKSPAENRSNCSAEPASSSHADHLQLQGTWDMGTFCSLHCASLRFGAESPDWPPQSFNQGNCCLPWSFCGLSQQQNQGLDLKHCYNSVLTRTHLQQPSTKTFPAFACM